jgi:two-component system phosphate regulon sensor histidine kinase PhoR
MGGSPGIRARTFTGRLLLANAAAVMGVLLVLAVVTDRLLERSLVDQLTESLTTQARAVQLALADAASDPDLEAEVVRVGNALGTRITVIRTDGLVLADSEHDPATMQNHRSRPEIQQALRGRVGVATRTSVTIGNAFRYVALPPSGDRLVRVALPLTDVQSWLWTVRVFLVVGFGLAVLAGLAALLFISRRSARPLERVGVAVDQLAAGDLSVEVPEDGPPELANLARTINRMRDEIGARIAATELERETRDAILASLGEGVTLVDAGGEILYQNHVARGLIGSIATVGSLDPPALRELVDRSLDGSGRPRELEVQMPVGNRTVQAGVVPVPGQDQVLLTLRDVTEAKAVDAVRRDFVANASHELKTPVASIRALAETIAMSAGDDPDVVPRFAAQLEREAVRLSRIVSDLLDLSRLEGHPGEFATVRLDVLVVQEAERFLARAEGSQLRLAVRAEDPVMVRGSAQDLGLMVRNLVENAIQYTRPGGRVEVGLRTRDGWAELSVEDNGLGIPVKDQARIFERFYRVDRARSRETGGTGLGLSIVRHVVENHGGTVTVRSALGQGSTFSVRLPTAGP